MSTNPEGVQASESGKFSLAKLALLSLLTGAAIGLVIGCFRLQRKHQGFTQERGQATHTTRKVHQDILMVLQPLVKRCGRCAWKLLTGLAMKADPSCEKCQLSDLGNWQSALKEPYASPAARHIPY